MDFLFWIAIFEYYNENKQAHQEFLTTKLEKDKRFLQKMAKKFSRSGLLTNLDGYYTIGQKPLRFFIPAQALTDMPALAEIISQSFDLDFPEIQHVITNLGRLELFLNNNMNNKGIKLLDGVIEKLKKAIIETHTLPDGYWQIFSRLAEPRPDDFFDLYELISQKIAKNKNLTYSKQLELLWLLANAAIAITPYSQQEQKKKLKKKLIATLVGAIKSLPSLELKGNYRNLKNQSIRVLEYLLFHDRGNNQSGDKYETLLLEQLEVYLASLQLKAIDENIQTVLGSLILSLSSLTVESTSYISNTIFFVRRTGGSALYKEIPSILWSSLQTNSIAENRLFLFRSLKDVIQKLVFYDLPDKDPAFYLITQQEYIVFIFKYIQRQDITLEELKEINSFLDWFIRLCAEEHKSLVIECQKIYADHRLVGVEGGFYDKYRQTGVFDNTGDLKEHLNKLTIDELESFIAKSELHSRESENNISINYYLSDIAYVLRFKIDQPLFKAWVLKNIGLNHLIGKFTIRVYACFLYELRQKNDNEKHKKALDGLSGIERKRLNNTIIGLYEAGQEFNSVDFNWLKKELFENATMPIPYIVALKILINFSNFEWTYIENLLKKYLKKLSSAQYLDAVNIILNHFSWNQINIEPNAYALEKAQFVFRGLLQNLSNLNDLSNNNNYFNLNQILKAADWKPNIFDFKKFLDQRVVLFKKNQIHAFQITPNIFPMLQFFEKITISSREVINVINNLIDKYTPMDYPIGHDFPAWLRYFDADGLVVPILVEKKIQEWGKFDEPGILTLKNIVNFAANYREASPSWYTITRALAQVLDKLADQDIVDSILRNIEPRNIVKSWSSAPGEVAPVFIEEFDHYKKLAEQENNKWIKRYFQLKETGAKIDLDREKDRAKAADFFK